ncbi:DUF885 domain-containing protein [Nocardia puris]|uniref:Uncharacterized protein (DUF885 family) n=1 Tax=Nocardia puris TaxID=208602 RepID=A0A366DH72_9NOCA|nr:DUF885 domain-containing protein [Nocardia puris]MBF6213230.1 DUF885 domain-containing protein [Nocardia puris]MBF6462109.1 DUF885 domain-containing protein [Nocardia puris]RBO89413.1 uncharacterized protein (DUF885 family) [Nocardia puris]
MDDELRTLADRYWDATLAAAPSLATLLGDHRFDDRVEDLSVDAERAHLGELRAVLARVDALDTSGSTPQDRTTHALLRGELSTAVAHLEWRPVELASGQMAGVHAELLTAAPQMSAPEPEHARALVRRHRQFGTMLDQATARFRDGLAAGRTPARIAIERSVNQLDGYLATDPAADPFVTPAGPPNWDGEAQWRAELAEVSAEVIRPALARYRAVLAGELLPAARPDERPGLCWLGDDGTDIYERQLRRHTTLSDLGPERIHELGLSEIDSLRAEYAAIGTRVFGTSEQAEIFARLREDPDLRYVSGDEIMADARRCLAAAGAEMGDWFGRLPKQDCEIVAVPDFLAADTPAAYYFPPAADGSRPGTYFVNLHEPTDRGRFETAAVAYHEAIPGHHLQLTIATELEHLPRFQRQSFANTAFVEGWALYTERLADEMGLYEDDLARMGMLAADSWRSCRLVVDTGLHAMGWSRQRAIDFMVANTPVGLGEITVEVDRYIAMPGQAVSYKVGQLEIRAQRAAARERLGAAFDIKAFHDAVLGSGSVSLPVLRELVAAL